MIPGNRSWTPELERKARGLTLLLLDVDGVLTDGRLHVGERGELFKSFSVRDGLAVKLAQAAGVEIAILSTRDSEIVARRAAEVGITEILQGQEDKGAAFRSLLDRRGLDAREIGYEAVRLESLKFLSAAHALYKSAGFVEITPYAENSMTKYQRGDTLAKYRSSAVFMELRLRPERVAGDGPPPPAS